jgi:hypothetical protein
MVEGYRVGAHSLWLHISYGIPWDILRGRGLTVQVLHIEGACFEGLAR